MGWRWIAGAAFASGLLAPAISIAGELHIYEHNASVIHWAIVGDAITATYRVPRPGLQDSGIEAGTVLFRGHYDGGRIEGKAYAFKAGCAPAAYEVIGGEQGARVVLRGPAPVRDRRSCRVTGYSARSPHANLVFIYSATHH